MGRVVFEIGGGGIREEIAKQGERVAIIVSSPCVRDLARNICGGDGAAPRLCRDRTVPPL